MRFSYIHNLFDLVAAGFGFDGASSRPPSASESASDAVPPISASRRSPAMKRPQTGPDHRLQSREIFHGRRGDDRETIVNAEAPKKRARFDIDDDSEDFEADRPRKRRHIVNPTLARLAMKAEASEATDEDSQPSHRKYRDDVRWTFQGTTPRKAGPEQSLDKRDIEEQSQPPGSRPSAERKRMRQPYDKSSALRFKKTRTNPERKEVSGADAPSAATDARELAATLHPALPLATHSGTVEQFMANVPPLSALRGNQKLPAIMGQILYGSGRTTGASKSQEMLKPRSLPKADPKVVSRPEIARQTKLYLDQLKKRMPDIEGGELWSYGSLPKLDPHRCPNLAPVKVEVINADTFDAAAAIAPDDEHEKPVYVLNMANAYEPGSAWQRHATAQEEELCRRSSLIASLLLRYYPLEDHQAIYSPYVSIFRSTPATGYKWLDGAVTAPEELPMVSVVTIAALQSPSTARHAQTRARMYKNPADRKTMKMKMRLILRLAAWKKHRQLVLGAFGCGAFKNPVREVANCWSEVLLESEFKGWFDRVAFSILDSNERSENWVIFREVLHGLCI